MKAKFLTAALLILTTALSAAAIDLNLSGVTVKEALDALNRSENWSIVANASEVDLSRRVSVNANNASIEEVLDQIFAGTGLTWSIKGRTITINKAKSESRITGEQDSSKKRSVTGTVVDKSGNSVIGASIVIKGTTKGTTTDIDGKFTIDGVDASSVLEISCISYRTENLKIGNGNNFKVVLQDDSTLLSEAVVVGFGTQKRANLTGAVSTISADELGGRPVVSTANALQGLDPAVNITLGTGSPESTYSIDIRGAASINSSSPLVLVDGIEMDLRAVNPNDIENISVLKDASASAIYGAKASAGVILVTTKNGASKEGTKKARINYNGSVSVAMNTTSTDFMTCGYDFVTMENYFRQSYQGATDYFYNYQGDELQKLLENANDKTQNPARPWVEADANGNYKYYANYDWFGYLYNRVRPQTEHNLSISGGDDNFNYYVSGRYLYQKGIFALGQSSYDDYAMRSKIGVKILPTVKYSNNISFDYNKMCYPGMPNYETTIAYLTNYLSPSFLPTNPDGSIVSKPAQLSSSTLASGILGQLTAGNTFNTKVVRTITLNNQLDWDIIKGLRLTAAYGIRFRDPVNRYRNNTYKYSTVIDEYVEYKSADQVENVYQENYYNLRQSNVDVYANYNTNFGKNGDHHFKATAGMQYMDYYYRTMQGKQYDLSNDDLATFAVATGEIKLQQTINTLATLGFFARVNYDYKNRYLLEISGRADGSSRFAPESRWGFFPSASFGWRVSEEPFWESVKPVMNNLKLRLSAGSLGNQQVSSYYTYIDEISTNKTMSGYTFTGTSLPNYASVSAPIASNLTWETVTTYNVGLDMGFFKGRLTFTGDAYIRDTDNMLTSAMTLPSVYGASTPKTNYASMRTKGFEVILSWKDRVSLGGKPFNYGITATLGDYTTKITKFKNDSKVLGNYYEGMTLGEIWGYHVPGLFESDEQAAAYQNSIDWTASDAIYNKIFESKGTDPGQNLLAGDMWFEDTNGDGVISKGANTADNSGDRKVIGNSLPRFSYSFRFDLSWNNIDLSAFFQGVGHQDWYPNISSNSGQFASDFFGPYANPMTSFVHKDFEKLCWSEDNTSGYFPRQRGYIARADGPLGNVNDYYLQNVGYIRLKNLSLGYTFKFKDKSFFEKIRLSLNGENLWYWSPLKKHCLTVDPELCLSSSTNAANTGVGYFYSKVFSFSVNLVF